jgi:hypothetical protein
VQTAMKKPVNSAEQSQNFLNQQLMRLMAQWPLPPERVKLVRAEFTELLRQIGEARFRAAVDGVVRDYKSEFFPPLARFREYVPEGAGERTRCQMCKDTDGWVYVPGPERAVKRCSHDGYSTSA